MLLGLPVKRFLKRKIKEPTSPEGLEKDCGKIIQRSPGGTWIGFFERIISLVSFWSGQHNILGAWLAFKVAAKWEVWKNIVQVPANIDGVEPLKWYQARNALGSWVLARFLIAEEVPQIQSARGAVLPDTNRRLYCL
jgi:hypothetical protein